MHVKRLIFDEFSRGENQFQTNDLSRWASGRSAGGESCAYPVKCWLYVLKFRNRGGMT
jgi:hypothetical protein